LLLDVRTKEEFSEEHIKNALNIPVQELEKRLDELKKYKNFEIIVYCRSGARSRRASEILVKNGFKFVYNLSGGIIEWKKQFEVEK
ncbi:Rhodanese-related sulfurtransferase, partial [Candidatus Kryptobacter tengchongensis]